MKFGKKPISSGATFCSFHRVIETAAEISRKSECNNGQRNAFRRGSWNFPRRCLRNSRRLSFSGEIVVMFMMCQDQICEKLSPGSGNVRASGNWTSSFDDVSDPHMYITKGYFAASIGIPNNIAVAEICTHKYWIFNPGLEESFRNSCAPKYESRTVHVVWKVSAIIVREEGIVVWPHFSRFRWILHDRTQDAQTANCRPEYESNEEKRQRRRGDGTMEVAAHGPGKVPKERWNGKLSLMIPTLVPLRSP